MGGWREVLGAQGVVAVGPTSSSTVACSAVTKSLALPSSRHGPHIPPYLVKTSPAVCSASCTAFPPILAAPP